MSHPWGQSFQFLCPNYQSCWYQRSVQRYSSSLGHRDASSSASSPSLRYHRAEIVSQYSAFSFAFPGPNLTGLQASNRELLISIKESSTVFACRDCRSSSGLMMAMAYGLLAAGPNDTPPIELAPLLPSKLFVKRETSAVILKLWNLEWAPELAQAPA